MQHGWLYAGCLQVGPACTAPVCLCRRRRPRIAILDLETRKIRAHRPALCPNEVKCSPAWISRSCDARGRHSQKEKSKEKKSVGMQVNQILSSLTSASVVVQVRRCLLRKVTCQWLLRGRSVASTQGCSVAFSRKYLLRLSIFPSPPLLGHAIVEA
jgi:hypothetical protein